MFKNIYDNCKKSLDKANRFRHKLFRGSNLYFFVTIYFLVIMGLMIYYGQWLSPDRFLLIGFLLAIIVANPLNFIKDWIPFLLLILSYEFLRGLGPQLNAKVHIFSMIDFDKVLGAGQLPTNILQSWLYVPGKTHIYDLFFAIIYMLHFALPLIFAYVLWSKKRDRFRHFAIGLLVLSYLGFITYILYPAMPPWMASAKGYIPHVYKIFDGAASHFFHGGSMPTIYWLFKPNEVAAMPSLHAAYPMLVYLYMLKYFGKKTWWFIFYVLSVWFAVVYMGEHYVIDVIVGALYAVLTFYSVEYFYSKYLEYKKHRKLKPALEPTE